MTKQFEDGPSLQDFLPDVSEGYQAEAGISLPSEQASQASEEAVIAALETVQDPEIPVNIYELGLIYDIIRHDNGDVMITMSLTAPGCPVAGEMPKQVAEAVAQVPDVGKVTVSLVWEPAWTKDRMSEDAKMALDLTF
ncbi:MAG: DUF59 domain-containing protein [Candidatus Puniceispirillaceae bacterium]